MEDEKIRLSTEQEQRINKLIEDSKKAENKRPFQTCEEFVHKAVDMWLAWEENPQLMIGLMNSYPKTQLQEDLMEKMVEKKFQSMGEEGGLKLKNPLEASSIDEEKEIKKKEETNDLKELRNNLKETKKFIQNNRGVNKLDDIRFVIHYDNYPLIWKYYSRILPVKLILTVLADMMRKNEDDKIKLNELRVAGIDISKEFFEEIKSYEGSNKNINKTNSLKPGFPDVTGSDPASYEMQGIQKRFGDRFVGKIVSTKNEESTYDNHNYIQGALAALDLITCFEEMNETYVTFTPTGRDFYLLDNDLINKDFSKEKKILSAFSSEENEFIYTKVFPKRELEYKIINNILEGIEKSDEGKCTADEISNIVYDTILGNPLYHNHNVFDEDKLAAHGVDLDQLDKLPEEVKIKCLAPCRDVECKFKNDLEIYDKSKNRKEGELWLFGKPKLHSWRAATMGRLVEIKKVKWTIESHGSEYKFLE